MAKPSIIHSLLTLLPSDIRLVLGAAIGLAFGLPQVYFLGVIAVPLMDHYAIDTDWFGAIVGFMAAGIYFFSPAAGSFVDKHPRYGAALSVFGGLCMMGVALVLAGIGVIRSEFGFLLLGIAGSISVGMTYTICIGATASRYQGERKGLATGITACGLAVGTIAGSIIVEDLAAQFNVMTALLGMGLSSIAAAIPAGILLASVDPVSPKVKTAADGTTTSSVGTLTSRKGVLACVAFALTSPVLLIAFNHIGVEVTGQLDSQAAALVVAVLAIAGLPGRILAGSMSDRFGPVNVLAVSTIGLAISFVLWMYADGSAVVYFLFAVMYGISYSSIVVMRPLVILSLFGRARINTLTGAVYFISGPGCFAGAFAFGWVYERFDATYDPALLVSVALCCASAIVALSIKDRRSLDVQGGSGRTESAALRLRSKTAG